MNINEERMIKYIENFICVSPDSQIYRNFEIEKEIIEHHEVELSLLNIFESYKDKRFSMAREYPDLDEIFRKASKIFLDDIYVKVTNDSLVSYLEIMERDLLQVSGRYPFEWATPCLDILSDLRRTSAKTIISELFNSGMKSFPKGSHWQKSRFGSRSFHDQHIPETFLFGVQGRDEYSGYVSYYIENYIENRKTVFLPSTKITLSILNLTPYPEPPFMMLHVPFLSRDLFASHLVRQHPNAKIILCDSLIITQHSNEEVEMNRKLDDLLFVSWYDGDDGFLRSDKSVLYDREVYYLLHPHSGLSTNNLYNTARNIIDSLGEVAKVKIIDYLEDSALPMEVPNRKDFPSIITPKRFMRLFDDMDLVIKQDKISKGIHPRPPQVVIDNRPYFLAPYMHQGSINIFQTVSGNDNISAFYMPLAYSLALGQPYSCFSSQSQHDVLLIHGVEDNSIEDGYYDQISDYYRTIDCNTGYYKFRTPHWLNSHPIEYPRGSHFFLSTVVNSSMSTNQSSASLIFQNCMATRPSLLILDFEAVRELLTKKNTPLHDAIMKLQEFEITIWLISRKKNSNSKVQHLSPDSILTVSEFKENKNLYLSVDIQTKEKLLDSDHKYLRFIYSKQRKCFQPQSAKSKYRMLEPQIREYTAMKLPELQIAELLNLSVNTLRQIKRQFGIRCNQAPKKRRQGLDRKIMALAMEKKDHSEIAKILNLSKSYVRKRIQLQLIRSVYLPERIKMITPHEEAENSSQSQREL